MSLEKFGKEIKRARILLKLTQKSLGEKLNVKESTVRMWELGKNKPSAETVGELAGILKLDLFKLLALAGHESILSDIKERIEKENKNITYDLEKHTEYLDNIGLIEQRIEELKQQPLTNQIAEEITQLEKEKDIWNEIADTAGHQKDLFVHNSFMLNSINQALSPNDLSKILEHDHVTFQGMPIDQEDKMRIKEYALNLLLPKLIEHHNQALDPFRDIEVINEKEE